MKFLTDIYDGIKKRYVLRLWYAANGAATTASIYLAGVIQGWLMERAPMLVSEVEGFALAAVILGVFSSVILWLFSWWLGKPIAEIQREFGLDRTRVLGEKTKDAIIDAINDPAIYAMSEGGKIKICRPREIKEP